MVLVVVKVTNGRVHIFGNAAVSKMQEMGSLIMPRQIIFLLPLRELLMLLELLVLLYRISGILIPVVYSTVRTDRAF